MNNSSVRHSPDWIGAFAAEALASAHEGKVSGVTSKGVFLLVGRTAVFLTQKSEKSPFNVSLNEGSDLSGGFQTGELFTCSSDSILFPRTGTVIPLQGASQWIPPLPIKVTNSKGEQLERMWVILDLLKREVTAEKGWLYLAGARDTDEITKSVAKMKECFSKSDLEGCLEAAKTLIGVGGGLTPSGDDFLAGYLLYHVRANQAALKVQPFVKTLGEAMTELAYNKTTWISANRIEAACRGWSESVFLELLDHLFDNSVELPHQLTRRLLGFGHSSGVDTVLGIYSAANG